MISIVLFLQQTPDFVSFLNEESKLMNRLASLQITDSVYRLTMLSMVLSYADNSDAVDRDSSIEPEILRTTPDKPSQPAT